MRRGVPDPRAILRLARVLRRFSPDVVHSHMVHANLLARLARPFIPRCALISTAHNIDEGGRMRELAYRWTDRLADITTNVSRAAVQRFIAVGAVPASRIMHVPNGIDTTGFRPDDALRERTRSGLGITDEFVWLAVGRFDEQKDYPNLLRAFASCSADSKDDGLLLIAGDGPLRARIEALSQSLGIAARCRFLGKRSDVGQLMCAADAFVLASAWEGLPIVLLEAAAAGLPIVATDVGGNAEVVTPGESGMVVPPARSDKLADAMREIAALPPATRSRMGTQARSVVQHSFGIDAVVSRWETIYRNLMDGRPAAVRDARRGLFPLESA